MVPMVARGCIGGLVIIVIITAAARVAVEKA
jgi:hypothetical protein